MILYNSEYLFLYLIFPFFFKCPHENLDNNSGCRPRGFQNVSFDTRMQKEPSVSAWIKRTPSSALVVQMNRTGVSGVETPPSRSFGCGWTSYVDTWLGQGIRPQACREKAQGTAVDESLHSTLCSSHSALQSTLQSLCTTQHTAVQSDCRVDSLHHSLCTTEHTPVQHRVTAPQTLCTALSAVQSLYPLHCSHSPLHSLHSTLSHSVRLVAEIHGAGEIHGLQCRKWSALKASFGSSPPCNNNVCCR